MPLTKNKLCTKARGVALPKVQAVLENVKRDRDQIRRIGLDGLQVIMHTTKESNVELGELKPEYYTFVESLHKPHVSYQITGGYYLLIDVDTKKTVRTFGSTDELTAPERVLIHDGYYTYRQAYYGMNLEITDEG